MKIYEAVFNEEPGKGLYALSVVENPAMEDLWVSFKEHHKEIQLAQVDEEKRLLLGAALIPNKKILRNIDGNEFEMFFTEETIEKLAHSFLKNGHQNNSSLEHEIKLEGMSVVELWTVENPTNDKSNNFGKTYPKGTMVTMMKVDNDEVWDKVKSGEIKGFSIDALLGLNEIKLNTNINMNTDNKSIIDAIKDGFKDVVAKFKAEATEETQETTEEETTEEETTTVESTEETPEVMDLNALKEALTETLAQFSTAIDAKLDTMKGELSTKIEDKETKIEALKVELSKKPEVGAIIPRPEAVDAQLNATGRILSKLRQA